MYPILSVVNVFDTIITNAVAGFKSSVVVGTEAASPFDRKCNLGTLHFRCIRRALDTNCTSRKPSLEVMQIMSVNFYFMKPFNLPIQRKRAFEP